MSEALRYVHMRRWNITCTSRRHMMT